MKLKKKNITSKNRIHLALGALNQKLCAFYLNFTLISIVDPVTSKLFFGPNIRFQALKLHKNITSRNRPHLVEGALIKSYEHLKKMCVSCPNSSHLILTGKKRKKEKKKNIKKQNIKKRKQKRGKKQEKNKKME